MDGFSSDSWNELEWPADRQPHPCRRSENYISGQRSGRNTLVLAANGRAACEYRLGRVGID